MDSASSMAISRLLEKVPLSEETVNSLRQLPNDGIQYTVRAFSKKYYSGEKIENYDSYMIGIIKRLQGKENKQRNLNTQHVLARIEKLDRKVKEEYLALVKMRPELRAKNVEALFDHSCLEKLSLLPPAWALECLKRFARRSNIRRPSAAMVSIINNYKGLNSSTDSLTDLPCSESSESLLPQTPQRSVFYNAHRQSITSDRSSNISPTGTSELTSLPSTVSLDYSRATPPNSETPINCMEPGLSPTVVELSYFDEEPLQRCFSSSYPVDEEPLLPRCSSSPTLYKTDAV